MKDKNCACEKKTRPIVLINEGTWLFTELFYYGGRLEIVKGCKIFCKQNEERWKYLYQYVAELYVLILISHYASVQKIYFYVIFLFNNLTLFWTTSVCQIKPKGTKMIKYVLNSPEEIWHINYSSNLKRKYWLKIKHLKHI